MVKKPIKPTAYVIEVNRSVGDNIKRAAKVLKQRGIKSSPVGHLTSLKLIRPRWMSWQRFIAAIQSIIQPQGQVFMHSQTGRSFVVDFWNWQRIM